MKKSIIAMLLVLVMALSLAACGGSSSAPAADAPAADAPAADAPAADAPAADAPAADGAKVGATVLRCAFNQTMDNPEAETLLKISDDLYDATEGRYSIEVYPSLEQVNMGVLEMTMIANSVIEPYAPDFAILGTPYVYDSVEQQERLFTSGKLDELYATTEPSNFIVLSAYSLGPRNLYTRDGPVTTPEELKGLQIRVMGSDTCVAMMNAMGGKGVTMGQGDVYSAIQTKTLDGAENNIITYVTLNQYEVAPYYNYTGHLMIPDELVINTTTFASMSPEDQAALKQVCLDSIPFMFERCEEFRAQYEEQAKELGVVFSDADVAAFQALCQDLIDEVANKDELSQSVYQAILSER